MVPQADIPQPITGVNVFTTYEVTSLRNTHTEIFHLSC